MRRIAFLTGNLIKSATRLATDVEPWADRIDCHIADFLRAGGRGDKMRLPIPRPRHASVADFSRFTHPLSRDRLDEIVDDFRRNTHIVDLVPGYDVLEGQISRLVCDDPVD